MKKQYTRRNFITTTTTFCIGLQLPLFTKPGLRTLGKQVKLGLITDLHQDIMHDGFERMNVFVKQMKKFKPDALLQLGDFAYPGDKNKDVIELYKNAYKRVLHVIGNHDTDAGFTKEQCIQYWGMPARYYTIEVDGIILIVLDGNDKGSPSYKGGYPAYVNDEQQRWLIQKLEEADNPVIIISHQPLAGPGAIDNAEDIQNILSAASQKVLLAINGHTHIDALFNINQVTYVHLNSASYFWVGDKYQHESYTADIHKTHPWISRTCPYKEALFSTLTIDPASSSITIEGRKSAWVGSSPAQLNYPEALSPEGLKAIVPIISNRHIQQIRM
jgi:3',5'-cyclic-AMP phosphodiesterase